MDKKLVIGTIAIAAVGFLVGRYTTSVKTVIKVETQIVEKEVIKVVEKKVQEEKRDTVTTEDEIVHPDGTVERRKKIVDRTKVDSMTDKNSDTSSEKSVTQLSESSFGRSQDWNLSLLATKSYIDEDMLGARVNLGFHVQRRILGPFSVGVFGITNRTYGLSVGGSF